MPNKILAAAELSIAAAILAGVATASPSAKPKHQRIAIVRRNDHGAMVSVHID
jgi:hypothetical protein